MEYADGGDLFQRIFDC
jgi:NIMA (never in mitosis gene a)-related kinase